jgi:hypothetical protein
LNDKEFIGYCQLIAHHAAQKGQAEVWEEKKEFRRQSRYLKRRIDEFKNFLERNRFWDIDIPGV